MLRHCLPHSLDRLEKWSTDRVKCRASIRKAFNGCAPRVIAGCVFAASLAAIASITEQLAPSPCPYTRRAVQKGANSPSTPPIRGHAHMIGYKTTLTRGAGRPRAIGAVGVARPRSVQPCRAAPVGSTDAPASVPSDIQRIIFSEAELRTKVQELGRWAHAHDARCDPRGACTHADTQPPLSHTSPTAGKWARRTRARSCWWWG